MIKHIAPIVAISAALLASTVMPAAAQQPSDQQSGGTYNWLHPKLGFVKVDRATNAMVRSQGTARQNASAEDRAVKTPATKAPQGATAETRN